MLATKSFMTFLTAAIVSFKPSDIIYAHQLVMVIFLLFKWMETTRTSQCLPTHTAEHNKRERLSHRV